MAHEDDYELLYTYGMSCLSRRIGRNVTDHHLALVTGQLGRDLAIIGQEIEKLYGVLNEDDLMLQ